MYFYQYMSMLIIIQLLFTPQINAEPSVQSTHQNLTQTPTQTPTQIPTQTPNGATTTPKRTPTLKSSHSSSLSSASSSLTQSLQVHTHALTPHPQFGTLPFDGQRAFQFLQKYTQLGHRYYGAPQRDIIIQKMTEELRNAGCQVQQQSLAAVEPVSQKKYTLHNIIGRLHPERQKRIILGTHWDTRLWAEEDQDPQRRNQPITGANDGTSGLAVIFELALQLQQDPLQNLGIDFVLFDGEEFGRPQSNNYCQGSRYFVKHLQKFYPHKNPQAVFIIDMVGRMNTHFAPERSSFTYARSLTQLMWREADRMQLPAFKAKTMGPWITDDHSPFQKQKIPALLLIDYNDKHWHTHQDTLPYCSADSLTQVGRALWASFKKLDHYAKR